MLRAPLDDAEIASEAARLNEAKALMTSALALIDSIPVATDCDAHLDLAIHTLGEAIQQVRAGESVFLVSPREPGAFD